MLVDISDMESSSPSPTTSLELKQGSAMQPKKCEMKQANSDCSYMHFKCSVVYFLLASLLAPLPCGWSFAKVLHFALLFGHVEYMKMSILLSVSNQSLNPSSNSDALYM